MLIGEYGRTNRKQAILDKMNKNIPNSFVYNLCMYMNEMGIPGGNPDPYAKQAPQLTNSSISRRSHYWGWIATPIAAAVGLLIGLFINRQSETKNDFVVPIVAVETNGHNILDDNTDYSMFISM